MKNNMQLIMHQETSIKINKWFKLWDSIFIAEDITVEFSNRLKSTLGRTNVAKRHVRLNPVLTKNEHIYLDEVLCHELAHIAVYERFGLSVKPHGAQWAELMRKAGYEPRVRFVSNDKQNGKTITKYEHFCPVCQSVRYAGRAMTYWRCPSCFNAGLEGKLVIQSID
jgi:predicted SprT family Zn-dependent metalloprotease